MQYIFIFVLLFFSLDAKDDITKKIAQTSNKLQNYSMSYSEINKKMSDIAKAIIKQKNELEKQNNYLAKLKKQLKEKESHYKTSTSKLVVLSKSQKELLEIQNKIEEELLFFVAQSVSLSVMLEEESSANIESMMEFAVLKEMLNGAKEKAKELNKEFYSNSQNISSLSEKAQILQKAIASIDAKRKDVSKVQKANKLALAKLQKDRALYKKELKHLLKKQDLLKRTLSNLNIIKIDKEKKAREEKARRIAFEKRREREKNKRNQKYLSDNKNLPKVKRIGNSYQSVKTKRYRGAKTIAPLKSYTITKNYGTYTDPIYGIKIFNESISLKPKRKRAKVRTVFNGKVIYADKTAVLNYIVIVEHSNGMHTIYANLSQIAPNIRKGKKIKKGYTVGRVDNELIFEVTQKSYHINPVRLFR